MSEQVQKLILAAVAVLGLVFGIWQYADKRQDARDAEAIQRGEDRAMLRALDTVSKELRSTLGGYQQLLEDARIRLANLEAYNRLLGKERITP